MAIPGMIPGTPSTWQSPGSILLEQALKSHMKCGASQGLYLRLVEILVAGYRTKKEKTELCLERRRSKAARQTQMILKSPKGPKGGVVSSETRLLNQGTQRTKGACALNVHTIVPRLKGTSFHFQISHLLLGRVYPYRINKKGQHHPTALYRAAVDGDKFYIFLQVFGFFSPSALRFQGGGGTLCGMHEVGDGRKKGGAVLSNNIVHLKDKFGLAQKRGT